MSRNGNVESSPSQYHSAPCLPSTLLRRDSTLFALTKYYAASLNYMTIAQCMSFLSSDLEEGYGCMSWFFWILIVKRLTCVHVSEF